MQLQLIIIIKFVWFYSFNLFYIFFKKLISSYDFDLVFRTIAWDFFLLPQNWKVHFYFVRKENSSKLKKLNISCKQLGMACILQQTKVDLLYLFKRKVWKTIFQRVDSIIEKLIFRKNFTWLKKIKTINNTTKNYPHRSTHRTSASHQT